ncbi:MAG: DNA polymerase III subunit epsilon [Alphaproteobacteria bacterium]|nr:DNA polymerase III subunit epsilon [Alphaproteobacteria bacterium]MBV8548075.1 DNA polymerase III subunit epsilon [Alphaproteobacteria bacterium]
MREIVLDTETTGLDPLMGHRVVEIGCVELVNHIATGQHFHVYLNPERDMPAEAARVHGLTEEFLADKPVFAQVVDDFLTFIGDAPLIAHNASFDINFVNAELVRSGFLPLDKMRAIDTVQIARRKFPGAPASLDALCKRFGVDASARQLHGALLDAQLLAEVYLELRGGRQPGLAMDTLAAVTNATEETTGQAATPRSFRAPRPHAATDEELSAHNAFLDKLKDPIWRTN